MDKLKKIFENIVGSIFVILFLLLLLTIISVFYGSIMKVFGLQYDSFGSVVLFIIITEIVSLPGDLIFSNGLSLSLLHSDMIGKLGAKVIYALCSTSINIFSMLIVDYFMDSVTVSPVSVLIISVIAALLGTITIGNKNFDIDIDD